MFIKQLSLIISLLINHFLCLIKKAAINYRDKTTFIKQKPVIKLNSINSCKDI